ncbi:peptidase M10A and M12B matrixin and adamalysin [Streptococcus suis R61]|uniref:Peptidase M10A and M12B matrixin and adamalysin n=1 Tax=Streptococcus suis R61 TaxID=996306 RepID=A0AA87FA80_STRSU|nr:peptidase M10A and M12B matrixin and adamalysin [Streptococcus suis R61]
MVLGFLPSLTAEHELGHAIGLDHEDSQTSVMESAGSNHGIQQADIDAVLALYSE